MQLPLTPDILTRLRTLLEEYERASALTSLRETREVELQELLVKYADGLISAAEQKPISDPRYFVVVFGDPNENGDPVDGGQYQAGERYAPFTAQPGDMLLLYCTDNYTIYAKQVPGIGVAIRTTDTKIDYRWIPFMKPIQRTQILEMFEPEDRQKMQEVRFNQRRVFEVSAQSFKKAIAEQPLM
jgi:hypothetical protein